MTQAEYKPTLSDRVFHKLGERIKPYPWGRLIVEHVLLHQRIYREGWSLLGVVILVVIIRFTILTAFYIPSPSMLDTLKIKDRVFVFRLAYLMSKPKMGDIVVFKVPETIPNYDPDKPIWIKRVVGVAGDRVEIRNQHLYVNDKLVEEPSFFRKNRYFDRLQNGAQFVETTVPEGEVLVFGDNSADSYDSRYWGPVPANRIIGKAFFRYWPLSRIGSLYGESVNPFPPGRIEN